MSICRATKKGPHIFDRYNYPSPFDEESYKKIDDIPDGYNDSFEYNLYDYVDSKEKSRIFFFAEYIKRKFYLDCYVVKDKDENYVTENNNEIYVHKKYDSTEDLIDAIIDKYSYSKSKRNALFINKENDTCINFIKNNNVYDIIDFIYFSYNCLLENIISALRNPKKYFSRMTVDNKYDEDCILEFSRKKHELYEYERIIYYLSDIKECFHKQTKTDFNIILNFIDRLFWCNPFNFMIDI